MADVILVLNAGSSSVKFSIFAAAPELPLRLRGRFDGLLSRPRFVAHDPSGAVLIDRSWPEGTALPHGAAIGELLDWAHAGVLRDSPICAVGHRVVHGGTGLAAPLVIDVGVVRELERLIPLAPLHQPHNIAGIRAVCERAPGLPQVACFDTAFHRSNAEIERRYALPQRYFDEGVQRYGFHGLSYEYIAEILPRCDARAAAGRTIVLHLGNGSSLCAMRGGRGVATTMGFTPLDGVPMGTRCGSIDPGVLIYLMDQHGFGARELERLLFHESGLLGVSELSNDVRTLLSVAGDGSVFGAEGSEEPRRGARAAGAAREATTRARLAIELYIYRIGREIGSLAAALGGLDALVFTAGIGENAAPIRAGVCRRAAWLGVELDGAANAVHGPRISTTTSRVSAWVLPTDEERVIARATMALLGMANW
jgi:acetate kinase